jgi:phospholipid/cholesterol/gamma-HCH transport system substrate-binding protein
MKRNTDFVVGAVVLLAIAVILGATLWAGQAEVGEKRVRVTGLFRDAGGTRVGDQVVIRGVESGRVEAIELADDGWVQVRMRLDPAVRLPARPVALLGESSLFGEWEATITDAGAVPEDREVRRQVADAVRQAARTDADTRTIPGATLPDIAQLTTVAGRIAGDVASVANRVQVAFDDRAARELRVSIANFARMSDNMSRMSAELARTVRAQAVNVDSMSADVRAGAHALNQTAGAFQRVAERIDSSTSSGQLREIVLTASHAATQLDSTTIELRRISGQLSSSAQNLERLLARSDSVVAKLNSGEGSLALLLNDPSLYRNTDSLLVQLRALTADLQANPKKYLSVRVF